MMRFWFIILALEESSDEEEEWGEWEVHAPDLKSAIQAVMQQSGRRVLVMGMPKEFYTILDSSLFVPDPKSPPQVLPLALRHNRGRGYAVLSRPTRLSTVKSPIDRLTEEMPGFSRVLSVHRAT